ncbi:UvrD-helicase domain-containing protein [Aquimarina intermedia]|uniref:DNA 3'-5' helicase n=1 Tax=Aquimarina intermedia TaxID=350814 RepID=A0A5S5CCA1_9FLAO|nr:UvrD-helicase domain-containing protein [Aquimarina intermedia]TYP77001.1 ATP-dependent exoDNAse (exonuclease V) beta subunit [Aquimarina intermedia]
MKSTSSFTVYNAAAGAGKTYTLVREYLVRLLMADYKEAYKNILAITFTNKAVAEMKSRILDSLVGIASKQVSQKYEGLLNELAQETGLTTEKLQKKANQILKSILHNYAAFDIVTIDTFTHRVIRTFAHDLSIPVNFEIEMDTETLVSEAVDAVVAKIGEDRVLTQTILDFAFNKLDDDKSWDIAIELNKVAKLLFSENDRIHLEKLSNKRTEDFKSFQKLLLQQQETLLSEIKALAEKVLNLIEISGLDPTDFKGKDGYVPAHFKKMIEKNGAIDFKAGWKQAIETTDFYTKTLVQTKKDSIDEIRPFIVNAFLTTKNMFYELKFVQNILKNLVPLSILSAIHKELTAIKKERNILLISEFNEIISDAIQDQPAPFIYERLGERYRDYFIDEFQDTSSLQWTNLVPLIENAITTETLTGKRGKLTIVGDAKQAIYRWRGGRAEQFIELSQQHTPFSTSDKEVLNLPTNYRSCAEIINFNNDFFTYLSKDFSDTSHTKLYEEGNKQLHNSKEGGFINLSFIEAKNVDEENERYPEAVYETILELCEKGYALRDICILTRRQREGTHIADYLTERSITIVSSETLLINNAPEVQFIVSMLTWSLYPQDLITKTELLHFLAIHYRIEDPHRFIKEAIHAEQQEWTTILSAFQIEFDFNQLLKLPFYEVVEYIVSTFNLHETGGSYVQFFLDTVFSYQQQHEEGILGFLSYWSAKKTKLSIVAPEGEDAVRIMTIHKAKGLEFKCVIYPYANVDIYREIEPKTWFPFPDNEAGFTEVLLNYSSEIAEYSTYGQELVEQRKAQLELDAFNLLYVAFTRAEEQLYVLSKFELSAKKEPNSKKFSGKLIGYLEQRGLWKPDQMEYIFGEFERPSPEGEVTVTQSAHATNTYYSNRSKNVKIVTNSGLLWNTNQKAAIEKGNLLHYLMSKVMYAQDVEVVIDRALQEGLITKSEQEFLKNYLIKIVKHPQLSEYFSEEYEILNEKEIFSNGKSYRPDRIILKGLDVSIMDYKTGTYSGSHAEQIYDYGELMKRMGYKIKNRILVYSDEEIALRFI